MNPAVAITGMGSISPLGSRWRDVRQSYMSMDTCIDVRTVDGRATPVAGLKPREDGLLNALREREPRFKRLDRSVLMAIHAACDAVADARWSDRNTVGINIGSSRGATHLLERHHEAYLNHPESRARPLASPSTTLGNLASWVGQAIGSSGIAFSHSMTCSTALHAVANGIAWLNAGMAQRFLVGGTEAPLTGFSIAQMKALKVYAQDPSARYPCRPLATAPIDSVVLGEGAVILCLEPFNAETADRARAIVSGLGYATEKIGHATALSIEGYCFRKSMRMALASMAHKRPVDAIIMHAPGTVRGDAAELNAVRHVFGADPPMLISNKWRIGHTFGASGALSIELALHLVANGDIPLDFPYPAVVRNRKRRLECILVNAAGFGGNAVSLVIEK